MKMGVPMPVRRLPVGQRHRLERTLLELRVEHGLPYTTIAVVFDLYEGVRLSEHQVRSWARLLGAAASPAKVENCLRTLHGRVAA